MLALCVLYSFKYSRTPALIPLTASVLISATLVLTFKNNNYYARQDNMAWDFAAQKSAGIGALLYILFLEIFTWMNPWTWRVVLERVNMFFFALNSLLIIFQYFYGYTPETVAGLYGNSSISGSLVVCQAILIGNLFSMSLGLLAVMLLGSSVPVVLYILVCTGWMFARLRGNPKVQAALVGVLISATCVLAAYKQMNPSNEFLADRGRVNIWRMTYYKWRESGHTYFGLGPGTSLVNLPVWEIKTHAPALDNKDEAHLFMWAHNDWLQLLIECGVVGLMCGLYLYIYCMYSSYPYPKVFAALLGYGGMMAVNYPIHMPMHALFGGYLVWLALRTCPRLERV